MTNHAYSVFSILAVACATLFTMPALAQTTTCRSGDLFCAEVRVGSGSAGVRIGGAPNAPVVVQQPAPPPVVVQPAPPPVVVQPAPPPPVVVRPAPQPPVVIVRPAPVPQPRQVLVRPAQPQQRVVIQQPRVRHVYLGTNQYPESSAGLNLRLDGIMAEQAAIGGVGAAFRLRPNPVFAFDIGVGVYGGEDYNGADRLEIPVTVDALVFFNPQSPLQFYAVAGANASWANIESSTQTREAAYLGGSAGLGVEWRLSRDFALNAEVRGFIRERVDNNPTPEFSRVTPSGIETTDTSGGFAARVGMTIYVGD